MNINLATRKTGRSTKMRNRSALRKSRGLYDKYNTIILLSFLILLLAVAYSIYKRQSTRIYSATDDDHYGVIVDCGSTGSRAHIFKWPTVFGKPKSLNEIVSLKNETGHSIYKHITPGLSSFKDKPQEAALYMDEIMRFLNETIPANYQHLTQIHFLATAGMRLLDKSTQTTIFNVILNELAPRYKFPIVKAQVISGRMEGAFSWLSLNLQPRQRIGDIKPYGLIELGGASAQVTYKVTPEIDRAIYKQLIEQPRDTFAQEQFYFNMRQGETHKLFSTTFLGLGVNSARELAIDLLLLDRLEKNDDIDVENSLLLKDPCLNFGSSESVFRPAELILTTNAGRNESKSNSKDSLVVNLEGSGNFDECYALLERILNQAKADKLNCVRGKKNCPMELLETNFIPFSEMPFVGLSEMFYTTNELMRLDGPYVRIKVFELTKIICSLPYEQLFETYPVSDTTEPDRHMRECFKSTWMQTLLHKGFKMPVNYSNFTTIERIDGRLIDWTVGAMILKAIELSESF